MAEILLHKKSNPWHCVKFRTETNDSTTEPRVSSLWASHHMFTLKLELKFLGQNLAIYIRHSLTIKNLIKVLSKAHKGALSWSRLFEYLKHVPGSYYTGSSWAQKFGLVQPLVGRSCVTAVIRSWGTLLRPKKLCDKRTSELLKRRHLFRMCKKVFGFVSAPLKLCRARF